MIHICPRHRPSDPGSKYAEAHQQSSAPPQSRALGDSSLEVDPKFARTGSSELCRQPLAMVSKKAQDGQRFWFRPNLYDFRNPLVRKPIHALDNRLANRLLEQ